MTKLQSYCRFWSNREFATKPPQMRKFVHIVGSLFAQVSYNHDSNSWLCYLSSVYDHFHCFRYYMCCAVLRLWQCFLIFFSSHTMLSSWSDLKMLFSSLHWLHNDWMQTMPHTWNIIVTIKPSQSWLLESSASWWWHVDRHHNLNDFSW